MLRIMNTGTGELGLTGRLVAGWVDELARVVATGDERSLRLDLREVTFVDRRGAALLRRLAARGVVVTNASMFVSTLVWGEHDDCSC